MTSAWAEDGRLFPSYIQSWHEKNPAFQYDQSQSSGKLLVVDVASQSLTLFDRFQAINKYTVSTSRNGTGNTEGSFCTPLGLHRIAEKIGEGCEFGEIFIGRQAQGRCFLNEDIAAEKDIITSRILWLSGLEPGVNQGGECDSYNRYIYIHGTAEEARIGEPASIGCVRMKNEEVIELFDKVDVEDRVLIFSSV